MLALCVLAAAVVGWGHRAPPSSDTLLRGALALAGDAGCGGGHAVAACGMCCLAAAADLPAGTAPVVAPTSLAAAFRPVASDTPARDDTARPYRARAPPLV